MKVGKQHICGLEVIAWGYEERCFARKSCKSPAIQRRLLQDSEARCPGGDNPPARCPGLVETGCRFRADLAPFGMHLVIRRILCFDRIKRARTNMQRHFLNRYPARREIVQKPWGEMQARRWRRDRPWLLRKERLIVLRVT